jgi:hypothetical protein
VVEHIKNEDISKESIIRVRRRKKTERERERKRFLW